MSKKRSWQLVFFAIFIGAVYYNFTLHDKPEKKENLFFISSKIAGRLLEISAGSNGERFRVTNSDHVYVFKSAVSYLNGNEPFSSSAKIGDSVFKEAFSDTLTLLTKSGKVYRYTFQIIK